MSTQDQICRLQDLRETPANARGEIDNMIQGLQSNQRSIAQENLGYLAVRNSVEIR